VIESIGVPYGSRTRVAAVKEMRLKGTSRHGWRSTALDGLTGTLIGLLMDARGYGATFDLGSS